MKAAHAKLGASTMERWSNCPGSIRECEGKPNIESEYAREGTYAHEVAADVLFGKQWPKNIDPDMKQHLEVYIGGLSADGFSIINRNCFVEHKFDLKAVYKGCFGTADAVMYDSKERCLYVWDLKFGAGLAVEVAGNKQLLYYALGALVTLNFPVPPTHVEIVVCQPRCPHPDGPIRRWRVSVLELLEFESELLRAAKATEKPDAPLVAGDHCRFCPARGTCPELANKALTTAQSVFSPTVTYNPPDLALALERVELVEAWAKGVREFAYHEAQHGRIPPGYKMVQKRATRQWKEGVTASTIANYFTVKNINKFREEPKLMSPASAEKVLKGFNIDPQKLDRFVDKVSSGTKLVKESEAGTPVKVGPQAAFSGILGSA